MLIRLPFIFFALILYTGAGAILFCTNVFAAIQNDHPRIFLNDNLTIERIAYRVGHGTESSYDSSIRNSETWESHKTCYDDMKTYYDTHSSPDQSRWKKFCNIMAWGILHKIEGGTTYRDLALAYLDTLADSSNYEGETIMAFAIGYDWFFDDFANYTANANLKTEIEHTLMVSCYVLKQQDGDTSAIKGIWDGHHLNDQHPSVYPFAYMALAGENLTDATVNGGSYNGHTVTGSTFVTNALLWSNTELEYLDDAIKLSAGDNGGVHAWWGTYLSSWLWKYSAYVLAWRDAGMTDYISGNAHFTYLDKHFCFGMRPNQDQTIQFHDDEESNWRNNSKLYCGLITSAHITNSEQLKWAVNQADAEGDTDPAYYWTQPWYLLYYDTDLSATAPSASVFGDAYYMDGVGAVLYRTGWGTAGSDNDEMLFAFKCGDFYDGHQHLNNGEFQIYYKGALAIASGHYPGDLTGSQYFNYYRRSVSVNTMSIYDPDETYTFDNDTSYRNDGGQDFKWGTVNDRNGTDSLRRPQLPADVTTGSEWDQGDISDFDDEDAYVYALGDYTASYSSKVDEIKRGFVVFKDANDIVMWDYIDLATGEASDTKRWLLHCMDYPTVTGSVESNNLNGYGGGNITYSSASQILITDVAKTITRPGSSNQSWPGGDGRLYIAAILPADINVRLVGGPNSSNENYESDSYQFWWDFDGSSTGYAATENDDDPQMGMWRIEISPDSAQETELFLNVLHVTDSADPPSAAALNASTGGLKGVHLTHDTIEKVVLITPTSAKVSTAIEFSVTPTNSRNTYCCLFGLSDNGTYSIGVSGTTTKTITVNPDGSEYTASDDGTLAFSVAYSGGTVTQLNSSGEEDLPEINIQGATFSGVTFGGD